MTLSQLARCLVASALAGAAGCSSEPPRGAVRGRVTLQGKPVTGAMVCFEDRAAGVEVRAALDADGRFAVRTPLGDGLPPGVYRVAVAPGRVMAPGEEVPFAGQAPPKDKRPAPPAVPPRYHRAATADLSVEVKVGDNPPCDFDLKP